VQQRNAGLGGWPPTCAAHDVLSLLCLLRCYYDIYIHIVTLLLTAHEWSLDLDVTWGYMRVSDYCRSVGFGCCYVAITGLHCNALLQESPDAVYVVLLAVGCCNLPFCKAVPNLCSWC
jgi:hypothetical protein